MVILRRVLVGLVALVVLLAAAAFVVLRTGPGLELAWRVATWQVEGLRARGTR